MTLQPHRGHKEKVLEHKFTASEQEAIRIFLAYVRQVHRDFERWERIEATPISRDPDTHIMSREVNFERPDIFNRVTISLFKDPSEPDEDVGWIGWRAEYFRARIGGGTRRIYHVYDVVDGIRFDEYDVIDLSFETVMAIRRIQKEANDRIRDLLETHR